MARGKSVRLLTSIPQEYSPDFMSRLDKRTVLGKAVNELHASLIEHVGGDGQVTVPLRSIVNRYTWSEMILQGMECRAAAGEELDVGSWTQMTNTQLGLARLLGLNRRSKPVESLESLMYRSDDQKPEPAAAAEATADDRSQADDSPPTEEIAAQAPCAAAAL